MWGLFLASCLVSVSALTVPECKNDAGETVACAEPYYSYIPTSYNYYIQHRPSLIPYSSFLYNFLPSLYNYLPSLYNPLPPEGPEEKWCVNEEDRLVACDKCPNCTVLDTTVDCFANQTEAEGRREKRSNEVCCGGHKARTCSACGSSSSVCFGDCEWRSGQCRTKPGLQTPPRDRRCHGRNYGARECCSSSNQCYEGEGDCDSDRECRGDLFCGRNNCKKFGLYYADDDDCCEARVRFPRTPPSYRKCNGRNYADRECCSSSNQCHEGEGDCDSDRECKGDLVCGRNNCKKFGHYFASDDDCCERNVP